MMNIDTCATCAILWRDYAAATHAHVGAEAKLELARLRHDYQAIECLTGQAQTAADHRTTLRQQIAEHERVSHIRNHAAGGAGESNNGIAEAV